MRTKVEKASGENLATEKFAQLLAMVKQEYPHLGCILLSGLESRANNLACHFGDAVNQRIPGPYLRGIEELFEYLGKVLTAFEGEPSLKRIAFLVTRARADFEIAVEAVLACLNSVVLDHMRDVMEIEYLLREFSYDASQIEVWLYADSQTRYKEFRPAKLRERHAKHLGCKPESVAERFEYKLHSEMLHVAPPNALNDFAPKGFAQVSTLEAAEFGFWEIFEHARRLAFELHHLGEALAGAAWTGPDPKTALPHLRSSYNRTQVVLALFIKEGRFKAAENESKSQ
jgi:hypothetical protein